MAALQLSTRTPPALALVPPLESDEPVATADLGLPALCAPLASEEERAVGTDRRAARRHRLRGAAVRVTLDRGKSEPARGRVRDVAVSGGLFIETASPMPVRTRLVLSLTLPGGKSRLYSATVVRSAEEGMAVMLEVDEEGVAFLNIFVAIARTRGGLEIKVKEVVGDGDEVLLSRAWLDVRSSPNDPLAHQKFIDTCLAAKRLDYALEQLRGVQAAGATGEEFDKSLARVGQILGFLALSRAPVVEAPKPRRKLLYAAVAIIAIGIATLATVSKLTEKSLAVHAQSEK